VLGRARCWAAPRDTYTRHDLALAMARCTNYVVIRATVLPPNPVIGYFGSLTYTQKRFFGPSRWARFRKYMQQKRSF
jgi:hypothetical protein